MRIMTAYTIPTRKTIGVLLGGGVLALAAATWIIATGEAESEYSSFPPLLGGMTLLMLALVMFVLRVINQREFPPQP